ncbi:MAG: acetylxylan esterase [Pirellulaceae bacterium]|nr:acetylxylan esterase [Pirellulaceae bacterium]
MHRSTTQIVALFLMVSLVHARGRDAAGVEAEQLRKLPRVLLKADKTTRAQMVRLDLRKRLQAANDRSSRNWRAVESIEQWRKFVAPRIAALDKSLGSPDPAPRILDLRTVATIEGDGFEIRNIVFRSKLGLWVTANLYLPTRRPASMPGILICHSHHRPKEHGELQDMGMTWARAGCAVLVMDQLGHGERRQHPFRSSADFAGEFRVSRQDYYFRYDTGIQLHLAGESLVGWFAHDLRRGVDALLTLDGIDAKRILLLGSVAGGGDPTAVAGAIDSRIAAVVPFNFGGPQPETRYPLPADAETSFNYAGSGSWESTRNLRRSARDGFLPWVIVAGIAPRKLVFAHEFNWDQPRDPVWKRLQSVYTMHGARDSLDYTYGRGEVTQSSSTATHCTHIGKVHRRRVHQAFRRWFDIDVDDASEFSQRVDAGKLRCWTPALERELQPPRLCDALASHVQSRLEKQRAERRKLPPTQQRLELRRRLAEVLGSATHDRAAEILPAAVEPVDVGAPATPVVLQTEPGIQIPLWLLLPKGASTDAPVRVVIAVSQAGKDAFLDRRAEEIAELLNSGLAVCLPDLRGVGETKPDAFRGKRSADTGRSSTELMLGGTPLGTRLRDLRSVIAYLRSRSDVADSFAMWGESLQPPNPADAPFRSPRRIAGRPTESESLGPTLSLLAAVYEDDIKAVFIRGGLAEWTDVLRSQFTYIPHDVVAPGLLPLADMGDIVNALPQPVRWEAPVDAWNRKVSASELARLRQLAPQNKTYKITPDTTSVARWLTP